MSNFIRKIARSVLGKGKLYRHLRGVFVFNDLKSPRPLMVKGEPIEINWNNKHPDEDHDDAVRFVYLTSPMQRSGTNYLNHLLSLHPEVSVLSGEEQPPEDFILSYSDYLKEYVTKTVTLWSYWIRDKEILDQKANQLLTSLGNGLARMFEPQNGVVVLKTPDCLGIENFFHLFPNTKIIILTRDGRDTIESYMSSWGGRGNFNALTKRWNDRAGKILDFREMAEKHSHGSKILLVDYNSLNLDTRKVMTDILNYLSLDISKYDWEGMEKTPVLGSSVLRGADEKVNWNPIAKPENFNKEPKWKKWSSVQKNRFKRLAGKSLIDLGYESDMNW